MNNLLTMALAALIISVFTSWIFVGSKIHEGMENPNNAYWAIFGPIYLVTSFIILMIIISSHIIIK